MNKKKYRDVLEKSISIERDGIFTRGGEDITVAVPVTSLAEINSGVYLSTLNTCQTYVVMDDYLFKKENAKLIMQELVFYQEMFEKKIEKAELDNKPKIEVDKLRQTLNQTKKNIKHLNRFLDLAARRKLRPIEVISGLSSKNKGMYMNYVGKGDNDLFHITRDKKKLMLSKYLEGTAADVDRLPKNQEDSLVGKGVKLPVLINRTNDLEPISKNFMRVIDKFLGIDNDSSMKKFYKRRILKKISVKAESNLDKIEKKLPQDESDLKLNFKRSENEELFLEKYAERLAKRLGKHAYLSKDGIVENLGWVKGQDYSLKEINDLFMSYIKSNNLVKETSSMALNDVMYDNYKTMKKIFQKSHLPGKGLEENAYKPVYYLQAMFTSVMIETLEKTPKERENIYKNFMELLKDLKKGNFKIDEETSDLDGFFVQKILGNDDAELGEKIIGSTEKIYYSLKMADHTTQIEMIKFDKKDREFSDGFLSKSGEFIIPLDKTFSDVQTLEFDSKVSNTLNRNVERFKININVKDLLDDFNGLERLFKYEETKLSLNEKKLLVEYLVDKALEDDINSKEIARLSYTLNSPECSDNKDVIEHYKEVVNQRLFLDGGLEKLIKKNSVKDILKNFSYNHISSEKLKSWLFDKGNDKQYIKTLSDLNAIGRIPGVGEEITSKFYKDNFKVDKFVKSVEDIRIFFHLESMSEESIKDLLFEKNYANKILSTKDDLKELAKIPNIKSREISEWLLKSGEIDKYVKRRLDIEELNKANVLDRQGIIDYIIDKYETVKDYRVNYLDLSYLMISKNLDIENIKDIFDKKNWKSFIQNTYDIKSLIKDNILNDNEILDFIIKDLSKPRILKWGIDITMVMEAKDRKLSDAINEWIFKNGENNVIETYFKTGADLASWYDASTERYKSQVKKLHTEQKFR
jgi:hypothetical protein